MWSKKREPEAPLSQDQKHHIRNAMMGVALERNHLLKALAQAVSAHKAMDEHMDRIKKALEEDIHD